MLEGVGVLIVMDSYFIPEICVMCIFSMEKTEDGKYFVWERRWFGIGNKDKDDSVLLNYKHVFKATGWKGVKK